MVHVNLHCQNWGVRRRQFWAQGKEAAC